MAVSLRPTVDRSPVASPTLMRLIAVCCALLVAFAGAWAISHAEVSLTGAVSAATQAIDAGVQVADSDSATVMTPDERDMGGVLLGVIVCLFLVFLGLLPAVFTRRLLVSAVVVALKRAVLPRHVPDPSVRPFVPALTVSQLSLSRT